MIAIDWSHTKQLTTFDGKKVRCESRKTLLTRILKDGMGEESIKVVKSIITLHSPTVVLEQGCPMSLCYDLLKVGATISLIDNKATEEYRKANGIEKSDEVDARIIYELATNGAHLQPIDVSDKEIQMHDIYHQYCRYQKARVAMENMRKAHQRQYGIGESKGVIKSKEVVQPMPEEEEARTGESREKVQSTPSLNLVPDLLPYDIAIETLHARENTLLKKLGIIAKGIPLFEAGGESKKLFQSKDTVQPPAIKGLGIRLWLGILVTANPATFECLSAYLRFCGLTSDVMTTHKYNRHAKMLYHLLAESVMKQRNATFRPVYDKCKADLLAKYPDYTKGHIHNAALNRTATFLAKAIFNHCRIAVGESIVLVQSIPFLHPTASEIEES